jgi:hypothetical protein
LKQQGVAMKLNVNRRRFVQLIGVLSAGWSGVRAEAQQAASKPQPANVSANMFVNQTVNRKNLVATQVKAYAWLDEGIDKLLDNLQEKGNVNTVLAFTYLSDPTDIVTGNISLPDHGTFGVGKPPSTGGANYDYDQKYFRGTTLKDFRSPDDNFFNVISSVAPKMKARGMSFFAWDYNNTSARMMRFIPGFTEVAEIDVYGRRTDSACFNNPDYRAHLTGKIESYLSGYPNDVDGIAWGCERMGPLDNLIGGGWATVGISCFCRYCSAKARDRGISIERAKQGYLRLDALFGVAQKKQRPEDGFFVTFWRTILEFPEILSWHTLWTDSYHEVRAELYGTAKTLAPKKPFGFHVVQNVTFSPFYSAVEDYAKVSEYADFIKVATYSNAGGGRMVSFLNHLCSTIFADMTPQEFLPAYYRMMNYNEKSYDEILAEGLSPDYVARETRRAIARTGGTVQIYPSVDIDVPVHAGQHKTTPESVRAEMEAAFGAGAHGVVLSREYTEMWLKNLAAAGDASRSIFARS